MLLEKSLFEKEIFGERDSSKFKNVHLCHYILVCQRMIDTTQSVLMKFVAGLIFKPYGCIRNTVILGNRNIWTTGNRKKRPI